LRQCLEFRRNSERHGNCFQGQSRRLRRDGGHAYFHIIAGHARRYDAPCARFGTSNWFFAQRGVDDAGYRVFHDSFSVSGWAVDCRDGTGGRKHEAVVEDIAFYVRRHSGGPYTDLFNFSPLDAKRDPRLQNSGRLIGFQWRDKSWPLEPLTVFYDWIYLNALNRRPALAEAIMSYNTFTDIAFNPAKSVICQAGAVALYVGLRLGGRLEEALASSESFLGLMKSVFHRASVDDNQQRRLI
jgi:hypothetical protein